MRKQDLFTPKYTSSQVYCYNIGTGDPFDNEHHRESRLSFAASCDNVGDDIANTIYVDETRNSHSQGQFASREFLGTLVRNAAEVDPLEAYSDAFVTSSRKFDNSRHS